MYPSARNSGMIALVNPHVWRVRGWVERHASDMRSFVQGSLHFMAAICIEPPHLSLAPPLNCLLCASHNDAAAIHRPNRELPALARPNLLYIYLHKVRVRIGQQLRAVCRGKRGR